MGLDSYLYKKKYINSSSLTNVNENNITLEGINIPIKDLCYLTYECLYWRKENHIHRFFVENCQDGVDDCRLSYVSREILKDLLDRCKKIKADNSLAEELLPVQPGFFFGSTEYDSFYFDSIIQLILQLETVLNETDDSWEFEYQSSW